MRVLRPEEKLCKRLDKNTLVFVVNKAAFAKNATLSTKELENWDKKVDAKKDALKIFYFLYTSIPFHTWVHLRRIILKTRIRKPEDDIIKKIIDEIAYEIKRD